MKQSGHAPRRGAKGLLMDRLLSMRVFERVVAEGGFAAAARALEMSPPVVTRLVADLEQHLGVRLLQRSTRHFSLTDAGQMYLSRVRNILQDIDEAHAITSALSANMAGALRIHAPPALASHVVAPLIAGFRQRYPGIEIELEVGNMSDTPLEDFDITLLAADAGFDGDVVARPVITSQAILVASPAYLAKKGLPQTPQELSAHHFLRLRTAHGRVRVLRLWHPNQPEEYVSLEIQPVLISNHTDALVRAALDGVGITSIPIDLVAQYLTLGQLQRVLAPWISGSFTIYAALPSRKFIPQRTRVFLDYLVEETRAQAAKALRVCEGACG